MRLQEATASKLTQLEDFDFSFHRSIDKAKVFALASGHFVRDAKDVLLCEPPGTGKSHLAQAIGYAVIRSGAMVDYRSIFDVVRDFLHDEATGGEEKLLTRCLEPDLLIIDDMGMKQLPKRSGEYLFEIITRAGKKCPTPFARNSPSGCFAQKVSDTFFRTRTPFSARS